MDETDFGTYDEDDFFTDMARITEYRFDPDLVEVLATQGGVDRTAFRDTGQGDGTRPPTDPRFPRLILKGPDQRTQTRRLVCAGATLIDGQLQDGTDQDSAPTV